MFDRRYCYLALGVLFSPITNASAILTTQTAIVSAQYGAYYNAPYNSQDTTDTVVSEILTSGFGQQSYSSKSNPNYGWVDWTTSENGLIFHAGQDIRDPQDYAYQGVGFSQLEFQWTFSVAGDGGVLYQALLSGTGAGSVILDDITASITSSLSVDCLGGACGHPNGIKADESTVNLLDGHTYSLYASLENFSPSDGNEANYIAGLADATIVVPEPGTPLILSIGLASLFLVGWKARET